MTEAKISTTETTITIEDLALDLCVGLLPHEKNAPQRILISMELSVVEDYLQTVDQNTIVDYGEICESLKKWEAQPHVALLETLVQQAADIALSYDAVTAARIHIRKPDIIAQAQSVGVELLVRRESES